MGLAAKLEPQQKKKNVKENNKDARMLQTLFQKVQRQEETQKKMQANLTKVEKDVAALQTANSEMKKANAGLQKDLKKEKIEVARWKLAYKKLSQSHQAQLNSMLTTNDTLRKQREDLKRKNADLQEQVETVVGRNKMLEQLLQKVIAENKVLRDELQKCPDDDGDLASEISRDSTPECEDEPEARFWANAFAYVSRKMHKSGRV